MDFKFDLLYNGSVYLFMSYKKELECGMWNKIDKEVYKKTY